MQARLSKKSRLSSSAVICMVSVSTILWSLTLGAFQRAEAFTKQTGDRGEMLVGELTQSDLYRECPLFKENADQYVPDKNAVAKIKRIKQPLSIIMFLGTWCGDSQRESPKLLKILDLAKNPKISITMYGVDDTKNDEAGLAKKYAIQRVPTILFLRGDKEMGRIVENPKNTMEADFLEIMQVK